jgi:IS5 family transposase
MEEALYEITSMRQFARLTLSAPIPEETTIMNLRHLLEKHQLAACILETINNYLRDKGLSLRQGTIVDATIIHTPCSTKNKKGKRDPEMHQTKKGCIEVRHGSGWCLHTEALTGDAGSSTGEWPQPMEGAKESPLLGGPRSITRRDGFAASTGIGTKVTRFAACSWRQPEH